MKKPHAVRVGFVAYRGWAFQLLDQLQKKFKGTGVTFPLIITVPYKEEIINYQPYKNLHILDPKDTKSLTTLVKNAKLNVILFYGWSWMVPDELTTKYDCLCLHPSLLPRYRGGTPIQHQILHNAKDTGLSIIRMNDILDGGDILTQRRFPLTGTISDIYGRMRDHGAKATIAILKKYQTDSVTFTPQKNLEKYPPYRRRKPQESELKFEQLTNMSGKEVYNFVRALGHPYPNAYITLKEGDKLIIQEVKLTKSPKGKKFDGTRKSLSKNTYFVLKDGYAWLARHTIAH